LNETDPFQVNAFMVDPADDNKQVSVTRAVAFKVDPQIPMIRIKTQDGLEVESCTLEYEIVNEDGTTETILGNDLRDEFPLRFDFTEKKNGKIKNREISIKSADTSKKMKFTYRDHDVNIDVKVKESKGLRYGCVLNINVCVNEESHPDLVGLLGTPNGDTTDDWMTSDGTPIDMPTSNTWLKLNGTDYCFDNHCVDDFADSMFDSQTWVNKCGDNNFDKGKAEEVLTTALNACAAANIIITDEDALYDAAMSCKPEQEDCSGCPLSLFPDAQEENDADNCDDPEENSGSLGDPHFKTWKNEHFEYHGQCDLLLAKDPEFADGLGLNVQIRTKLVRFWSYIKSAAIHIGDDILEVQGTDDLKEGAHHWINLEYKAEVTTIGGFPLSLIKKSPKKWSFEIDLNSKFPGQKIVISTYREFVKVDFVNGSSESFGKSVGVLGDFNTGRTLARDRVTELNDYIQLGNEWQVQPSEGMLFRDVQQPQFPKKCLLPEDPQGERRRRLDESSISVEQAEAACASLPNELDRKDCVYDILATQDLDMVGAF